jgi:hypothetical protein
MELTTQIYLSLYTLLKYAVTHILQQLLSLISEGSAMNSVFVWNFTL